MVKLFRMCCFAFGAALAALSVLYIRGIDFHPQGGAIDKASLAGSVGVLFLGLVIAALVLTMWPFKEGKS